MFVTKPHHDRSTDTLLVKVSVPVMDGKTAIGVIGFGIDYPALIERAAQR